MYRLAEVLHKTLAEVGQMSSDEFVGWQAYFKRKAERAK
jgi:hypothetical protein